jgi:hypothetical protein
MLPVPAVIIVVLTPEAVAVVPVKPALSAIVRVSGYLKTTRPDPPEPPEKFAMRL